MVEGIPRAPAVTGRVLLDATAHLIKGITGTLDDVKGVEHAGCVLELVINGVLISLEGVQCRDSYSHAEVFSALGQPVLVHGARPSRHQVQQAGRGMFLPASQVHDAGEFTWATTASILVVPYVLIDPQYLNPCAVGGVIRCGLQARLDMGPHGIPCGSSLVGQPQDSGSLEAQLSDRPADRPRPQTRPGSTHRVVLLNESHDPAGAFAAHPEPYCATGSTQGPRPKARRSPPPPRARDREQVTPQPGQPAQRS